MCHPPEVAIPNTLSKKWVDNDNQNSMTMVTERAAIANTTGKSSSAISVVEKKHLPSNQLSPLQQLSDEEGRAQPPPPIVMPTTPLKQGGPTAVESKRTHPPRMDCHLKSQSTKEEAMQKFCNFQFQELSQSFQANNGGTENYDDNTTSLVLQEAQIWKSTLSNISPTTDSSASLRDLWDKPFQDYQQHRKDRLLAPVLGQDDQKQKIDCLDNFYGEDLLSIQAPSTSISKDVVEEKDNPESSSKAISVVAVAAAGASSKAGSSVPDTEGKTKRKRRLAESCITYEQSTDSALVTCLRRNNASSANVVKNKCLCPAGTIAKPPPSQPSVLPVPMATPRKNTLIAGASAKDDTATFPTQHTQLRTTSFSLPSKKDLATVKDASISQLRITFVPPSVLASVINSEEPTKQHEDRRLGLHLEKISCHKRARVDQAAEPQETPQEALERILCERGYHLCTRIPAEEAGYDMLPSALQLASYGMAMVGVVETQNITALQDMLSAGLSPNPCNEFGDSVLDWVCKTANAPAFACFVQHGCEVRVSDKFGRTPFHYCCWSGAFSAKIASTLLQRDPYQIFIQDKRGETPLEYIRPELAKDWIGFLESTKDTFFPAGGKGLGCWNRRRAVPLPDPPNAISPDMAAAISSGAIIAPPKMEFAKRCQRI